MKFELYKRVALTVDLPEHGLRRGDVGAMIAHHPGPEDTYSVEVLNGLGDTLTVVTVRESQVEPLRADEVLSVRTRAAMAR